MEPEIIPPDKRGKQSAESGSHIRFSFKTRSGRRQLSMTNAGPFAILLILAISFLLIFVLMLGAVIIWIPIALLLAALALLLAMVRGTFGRRRS